MILEATMAGYQRLLAYDRRPPEPPPPPSPVLAGEGPPAFSTSQALSVVPAVIWDVNGYYRSIGADHRATRAELRKAYHACGGPNDAWKTYCFKQLLNPEVRYRYDRQALGDQFLDDYVIEMLVAKAKAKAAAKLAEMAKRGYELDGALSDDLIRQMVDRFMSERGLKVSFGDEPEKPMESPLEVVDKHPWSDEDEQDFWFSYYQWRTHCADTRRLRQWQELLVRAFSERGVVLDLSVGFLGRMEHPWTLAVVGYRTVVFLNADEQPTSDLAQAAADRVVQDQRLAER